MADILAQSLADLATARTAVLEEMKNRYPVGSEVSWRAGKGFSTGLVIGHAPFWTREPTRLWVKSIRNGKTKWVTPYNIPIPSYAAQPAQAVDLKELRRAVCVVGVVGQIDGHDVVRRNSVLDVIDVRRQQQIDSQAVGK